MPWNPSLNLLKCNLSASLSQQNGPQSPWARDRGYLLGLVEWITKGLPTEPAYAIAQGSSGLAGS